jgi:phenylalanine-4-hydroxylase
MAVGQSKQLVWIDLIASRLTPTKDLCTTQYLWELSLLAMAVGQGIIWD